MKTSFILFGLSIFFFAIATELSFSQGNTGAVWGAQQLMTPVNINGVPFDGSAPISIPMLAPTYNNAPSVTIQTVAAAGNGNQLSSTRPVIVHYSATLISTATIAGNASGYLLLEICSTNSAVAGDWVEIARIPNGQAVSLAVTLQAVSTGGGQVAGIVPAGYYRRLRSVITAGTPTFSFNSGQEAVL
jgi:hypothetical protein